jgi:hypothetical protein
VSDLAELRPEEDPVRVMHNLSSVFKRCGAIYL